MNPLNEKLRKQFFACGFQEAQIRSLEHFGSMLLQWQKAINLVSPNTTHDIWQRHLLDSAQLLPIIMARTPAADIVDLGSGGGLPGIVLAIGGVRHITLVESDKRKSVFLREVIRELKLTNCDVRSERIEALVDLKADIVTARALAPLSQLVSWANVLIEDTGFCLFLKGAEVENEVKTLTVSTNIELLPSMTSDQARIVVIQVSRETQFLCFT